jgi:hypothetical protein
MATRRVALTALIAILAIPALAHDYKLGSITIGQPGTHTTPPTAEASGGFLVITNTGTTGVMGGVTAPAPRTMRGTKCGSSGVRSGSILGLPALATGRSATALTGSDAVGGQSDHLGSGSFQAIAGLARARRAEARTGFGFGTYAQHGLDEPPKPRDDSYITRSKEERPWILDSCVA